MLRSVFNLQSCACEEGSLDLFVGTQFLNDGGRSHPPWQQQWRPFARGVDMVVKTCHGISLAMTTVGTFLVFLPIQRSGHISTAQVRH